MKCPKCGYNSFEFLDTCKKCGKDFTALKATYGIRPLGLQSYRDREARRQHAGSVPAPPQAAPATPSRPAAPRAEQSAAGAVQPPQRPAPPSQELEEFSWDEPKTRKAAAPAGSAESSTAEEFSLEEFVDFGELNAKEEEEPKAPKPEAPAGDGGFDMEDFFSSDGLQPQGRPEGPQRPGPQKKQGS